MLENLEDSLNDEVGQDPLLEVEDTIDQLFRFSRAVRRSGILRRFVRVARYTQYDDHGVNITEEFRKGVERIIELRLRDSRAGEELKRRLMETICLRQQHFAYLKDRQIQSVSQLQSQPLSPTRSTLAASFSVRHSLKSGDQPAQQRKPKPAPREGPSVFSATTLQSDRLPNTYARSENVNNDDDNKNNIVPEAVYLPDPPLSSPSQREYQGDVAQNELLRHVAEHLIALSQISLIDVDDNVARSVVEPHSSREDGNSSAGSEFIAERMELIGEAEAEFMDEDLQQLSCPPSTESLHWEFVLKQLPQADSQRLEDPIIQSFIEHNQQNAPFLQAQYRSNGPRHLTSASTQLRQSLIQAELRVFFQGTEQNFVPVSSRRELITMMTVLTILQELGITDKASSTALARGILESSDIIFAFLVHQNAEASILSFIQEGIRDDDLPFIMSHDKSTLETKDGRPIGSVEDWDSDSIRRLESDQYRYQAPIFHYQQHCELSDNCVFPITDLGAEEDFPNVFRAQIHAEHHDFYLEPSSGKNWEFLEIQRLIGQHNENWFWKIRNFHEGVGMLDEGAHFQTLLCTFRYQGDFFLIFPWADGNIQDLWNTYINQKPTEALISWSLTQMGNIAHSLAKVHQRTQFEFHGGMGPNRIKFFSNRQAQDASVDTCPITATILAVAYPGKDNNIYHDSGFVNVRDREGLLTYGAPDALRGQGMSSAADVWSLGCTYLEFVSWLLLGYDGIMKFSDWRGLEDDTPEMQTDYFYALDLQGIRPSIFKWTEKLKSHSECPKPLIAIIDFVMTEMILLKPDDRSSAERVFQWFRELHRETCEEGSQVLSTAAQSFLATSRERYLIKKNDACGPAMQSAILSFNVLMFQEYLLESLPEKSNKFIVVLEVGKNLLDDPRVNIPALWTTLMGSEADWQLQTVPQANLGGRVIKEPQGKLLGGSSGINGQAFIAPSQAGIDAWSKLSARDWSWENLHPYYKKSYTIQLPDDASSEHIGIDWLDQFCKGTSGPVKVSFPAVIQDPLCKAWVDTFKATGYGITADPFSGKSTGGYSNLAAVDSETKTRSYAASAYGRPAMVRANVRIDTEALVQRIIFKESSEPNMTASGVEVVVQGQTRVINANAEVIVCAGALNTPKLLELSGIGNEEILRQHNIPIIVNNPNVGENLQDHLMSGISFEVVEGVVTGDTLMRQEQNAVQVAMKLYVEHKAGLMTIGGVQSSYFMPLIDLQGPDSKISMKKYLDNFLSDCSYPDQAIREILEQPGALTCSMFMFLAQANLHEHGVIQSMPFSRGCVHIASADPSDKPIVGPRYFTHPADLEIMAQDVEKLHKAEPLANFLKGNGRRNHPDAFLTDLDSAKKKYLYRTLQQHHIIPAARQQCFLATKAEWLMANCGYTRRRCNENAEEERGPDRKRRVEAGMQQSGSQTLDHKASEGLVPGRLGSGMVMVTTVEVLVAVVEVLEMMKGCSGRGQVNEFHYYYYYYYHHHQPIFSPPNGANASNNYLDEPWCDPTSKNIPCTPKSSEYPQLGLWIIDHTLHALSGALRMLPLRRYAIQSSMKWVLEHQDEEGDWAGIYPAKAHSLLALKLEGYSVESSPMDYGLEALERFCWRDAEGERMQASVSPVWDTVLMTVGLCDVGLSSGTPYTQRSMAWVKSNQLLDKRGDWHVYRPQLAPGGFCFQYFNRYYPDLDDTAATLLAMMKQDSFAATTAPVSRAADFLLGLQNSDGGWGAYEVDNNSLWLNQTPFSDMDCLCDPATADITGRLFGGWFGRWGVNNIYGTSNALCGLGQWAASDKNIQRMVPPEIQCLKAIQNADGGWGEPVLSYKDISYAGRGPSTASQTAWALMGLLPFLPSPDEVVVRGIRYLLRTQSKISANGGASWSETFYTGMGFKLVLHEI
ncbi:glucose-methanol-choline oxidoreductase [Aspergillus affinis]|uniref:glucose-methanol-choline oxidoreductase n=1 Tax=Aspergillus affinis TaxID=1070780 RepID=UPI0022FE1538|nr:glucose-methanol-choline oxidoreductase [Aspergillus affinis]KAI9040770.1 glucose-methanol-choline oxidoreductase [Aspergillus affinis]